MGVVFDKLLGRPILHDHPVLSVFDVTKYGAAADGRKTADAAATNGSPIVTSNTIAFTQADVGKYVQIQGVGSGNNVLLSTIISVQSATQATLANNALVTATGKEIFVVTDDSAAIIAATTAALAYANASFRINVTVEVLFPRARYGMNGGVVKSLNGAGLIFNFNGSEVRNLSSSQSAAGSLFSITGSAAVGVDYIGFRNPYLVGNQTGGMGIRLTDCFNGDILNPRIKDFKSSSGWGVGLNMGSQAIGLTVINPMIRGCIYAGMQFGGASNANVILGGWIYQNNNGGAGVRVSAANSNRFLGTIIEGNDYGAIFSGGRNNSLLDCWIEANVNEGVRLDDLSNTVDSNWFVSNGTDIKLLTNSRDAHITRNRFDDGGKITIDSGADRVNIYKNTNLTTVTDNSAAGAIIKIEDNQGLNPFGTYAQGNATGATTFNRVNGRTITFTLTGNVTPTISGGRKGDRMTLVGTQDATGGRTMSKPANVLLVGGAFSPSAGAAAVDQWEIEKVDATNWVEVGRSLNVS